MFHYADGDTPRGPVPKEDLRGRINAQTLVWREGMGDWLPAGSVPELADLFGIKSTAARLDTPIAQPVGEPGGAWQPQPQPQPGMPTPMEYQTNPALNGQPPGMAIASMVLGIVGLMMTCAYLIGVIPAILAIVFGHMARTQGATGNNPGAGMATAGLIMGYIEIGLAAVIIVIIVIAIIIAAAS